jgi:glycosyltransferase involved in cell wall biosynthesis
MRMKLVICQRVCFSYRLDLFKGLAALPGIDFTLLFGEGIPGSKVQNAKAISGFDYRKLKTMLIPFGERMMVVQKGLLKQLRQLNPDVIVCEGESHFAGFLVAAFYRRFVNRRCVLIHWSLGGLPGRGRPPFIRYWLKRLVYAMTDKFIVYSSYGRQRMIDMGCPPDAISTVINVPNCARHIENWRAWRHRRHVYRRAMGVGNKFVVLYVGAFEAQKNIFLLLDIAAAMRRRPIQFILVGDGVEMPLHRARVAEEELDNVTLAGQVREGLHKYYLCADVFLLPGRGGMVIGEALACRLPVIVHHADGTERDLVRPGLTGVQMDDVSVSSYIDVLEKLMRNPEQLEAMGEKGQALVRDECNMETMIRGIGKVAMQSMPGRIDRPII